MTVARVRVYGPSGTGAALGVLPHEDLQFSVERGGGGGCTFTALWDDLDDLSAWDSVIHVELLTPPTTWTPVAAYALRPPFRRDAVGRPRVQCTAVALLEAWASETVILPEYSVGDIPRGAGTDRGVGWMSTAYDPTTDPNEAWDLCYNTARTTLPTGFPSGSGAEWISATGATDTAERKFFRSTITVATESMVQVWVSSDESGTLWLAAEPVCEVTASEDQGATFETARILMQPGEYGIGFATESVWSTGGDGVDPVLIAVAVLDPDDGTPDSWLTVSDESTWVACRRDDLPTDEPPGPTPGATIGYMVQEAQDRGASGWANVTLGFDAEDDSYAEAWGANTIIERVVRYGSDTFWSVWGMLAETAEVDLWLTPALVLEAAPTQGETTAVTLDTSDIETMSDQSARDPGTWAAGYALDGWMTATAGTPRREYAVELGTATSRAVAARVLAADLAENGRWDGSIRLSATAPVPLLAFNVGDTIGCTYADAPASLAVLSVSASAAEASLRWDLEVSEP